LQNFKSKYCESTIAWMTFKDCILGKRISSIHLIFLKLFLSFALHCHLIVHPNTISQSYKIIVHYVYSIQILDISNSSISNRTSHPVQLLGELKCPSIGWMNSVEMIVKGHKHANMYSTTTASSQDNHCHNGFIEYLIVKGVTRHILPVSAWKCE
jgi:hypothetical protein